MNDCTCGIAGLSAKTQTLTRAQAFRIHREQARKAVTIFNANADDLARVSFAVQLKENRQLSPRAKNPNSSASGMMQMLEKTQRYVEQEMLKVRYDRSRIWDPNYAVYLGQIYLLYQFKRYGDWQKAVHAYNQGSYRPGSKAFAAGEAYKNDVYKNYHATDFAALERGGGGSTTTASRTISTQKHEWG